MKNNLPDKILVWTNDKGENKWIDTEDPLLKLIAKSATGWLRCPRYTLYLNKDTVTARALNLLSAVAYLHNCHLVDLPDQTYTEILDCLKECGMETPLEKAEKESENIQKNIKQVGGNE